MEFPVAVGTQDNALRDLVLETSDIPGLDHVGDAPVLLGGIKVVEIEADRLVLRAESAAPTALVFLEPGEQFGATGLFESTGVRGGLVGPAGALVTLATFRGGRPSLPVITPALLAAGIAPESAIDVLRKFGQGFFYAAHSTCARRAARWSLVRDRVTPGFLGCPATDLAGWQAAFQAVLVFVVIFQWAFCATSLTDSHRTFLSEGNATTKTGWRTL